MCAKARVDCRPVADLCYHPPTCHFKICSVPESGVLKRSWAGYRRQRLAHRSRNQMPQHQRTWNIVRRAAVWIEPGCKPCRPVLQPLRKAVVSKFCVSSLMACQPTRQRETSPPRSLRRDNPVLRCRGHIIFSSASIASDVSLSRC